MKSLCSLTLSLGVLVSALVLSFGSRDARAQRAAEAAPYHVVSVSAREVVVRIAPQYWSRVVEEAGTGSKLTRMGFAGGVSMDTAGAPELLRLVLPIITPDRTPVGVDIVSQHLEVLPNIDLAPVPHYVKVKDDETPIFHINAERYRDVHSSLIDVEQASLFRTSYSERVLVSPIEYDASSRTVTRVKDLTIRIRFAPTAISHTATQISPQERELYTATFINGTVSEYYRSALTEVTAHAKSMPSLKGTKPLSANQWLAVETNAEGVYRITAQDLTNAGITDAVDPSTIELFGVGGEMLNESLDGTNGEWVERPIEVNANGQTFQSLTFYGRGSTTWKYSPAQDPRVDGLYHKNNPYSSTGHFLLKLGGPLLGQGLRVRNAQDTITSPITKSDRVFATALHEVDRVFETPNVGRELLGEGIPRADAGTLAITMAPPGYTGDSTTIRVAYDAELGVNSDSVPDSGKVAVTVNGQPVASVNARSSYSPSRIFRNWDNAISVSASSPLSIELSYTSSSATSPATLDFIELMYKRLTDIGSTSIPFLLVDTKQAFEYHFTNASGGEVWDVTNSGDPRAMSHASSGDLSVQVQGVSGSIRRLIAFSAQSLLTPHLAQTSAPTLRSTVGVQGAQEIIIAPAAFMAQANDLKSVREQGGQATEPITTSVVSLEDIYHDFGYGAHDLTAIRDFLAYTFRHSAKNGLSPLLYVTLIGSGHSDYQNRVTAIPNLMPAWEAPESEYLGSYRQSVDEPNPDDGFFERLVPGNARNHLDIAAGRISAHTPDEADGVVQKMRHYEHGSDQGDWRGRTSFVADDRVADPSYEPDGIPHLEDTEGEVAQLQDRLVVNKIYEVSYPLIFTSSGRHRPAAEAAIVDAFNSGSVLLSFVGHGNPNVWTHEGILTVPSTINKFSNYNRLAFVTTATCDFSAYDNYEEVSGGTQMLLKPDGGAIGMLGTSRSVTGSENLVWVFYRTLFADATHGTSSVGTALIAGKAACTSANLPHYYILGDPAQRLLVPKLFVNFDTINGSPGSEHHVLPALSQVQISGSVSAQQDFGLPVDQSFNGNVTLTLFDADSRVSSPTVFSGNDTVQSKYEITGPVLYKGTASVKNGRFSVSFIVPKDIKFDSTAARISGIAYADDLRSALGATRDIELQGSDLASVIDTTGPALGLYIGTRAFRSGDAVSTHSTVIVDVKDLHGLNTSTANVGHSFVAWVDDSTSGAVDLAQYFTAQQDDFSTGTSQRPMDLPPGIHTLHVRAFDTYDNPSFASVDFVAKTNEPYRLYDVSNFPNPLTDHTTFTFVQPGSADGLVHVALSIYTTDGRLIRTLATDSRQSAISITWDGRDDTGGHVANGAYVYQITADNETDGTSSNAQGKLIVAH